MNKLHITFFILVIAILTSCKKKDTNSVLGLDVQPENDLVGITVADSSSIFMHTQLIEKVRTYNDQFKYLGSTQDPIFGRTDAGIYTNFSIPNNLTNISFGASPMIDSVEIILRYTGSFNGDTSTVLNYNVYTLNEKILAISSYSYHTNDNINHSVNSITTINGKLTNRNGGIYLILKLDNNMAQYIIENDVNLLDNTAFANAYKGFYITATNPNGNPTTGAIRKFDLDDGNSGVKMYYHNGTSASNKGKSFLFTFRGPNQLRFNNIKHDYNSAKTNLYDQITGAGTNDTIKGNQNLYLNSFGGTRVRVYLPFLKSFADSQNVAINRAELIIKVDESMYNVKYGYPVNLALVACKLNGDETAVIDQFDITDLVKYNGNYDAVKKQYIFNIAREMQNIIKNRFVNYGFYIVNGTPNRIQNVRRDNRLERAVFGGINNALYKPKFTVTYIKFPYDK